MAIATRTAQTTWEGPLASGAITATVTFDEAGGVPTIVSSQFHVTATVPGLDAEGFEAVIGDAPLGRAAERQRRRCGGPGGRDRGRGGAGAADDPAAAGRAARSWQP